MQVLTNTVRKHKVVTQHILLYKKISYYVFDNISLEVAAPLLCAGLQLTHL